MNPLRSLLTSVCGVVQGHCPIQWTNLAADGELVTPIRPYTMMTEARRSQVGVVRNWRTYGRVP